MKKIIYAFGALTALSANVQQLNAQELEEIVVKTHPLSDNGLSQSLDVLSGDELAEELQSSLGETLAASPGVRSASFGGAVGRPVIHGLGSARVKTTEDRIDSLDVSVSSTDHAVTVEPFIADKITVLKGASTLIYGAGAIGGVVDTQTGRIPLHVPDEPLNGRLELRRADNADAETAAVRLDGSLGGAVAWHLDAFSKSADDYEIASDAESAALRATEAEDDHDDEDADGNSRALEGSFFDVEGGALGLSWVSDAGFIGVSVSTTDADYGLVGGHGHGHEDEHDEDEDHHDEDEHEDEDHHDEDEDEDHHDEDEHEDEEHHDEELEAPGRIELEQTRVDLEGQLNNPFAGIEKINLRFGVNDYQHIELEGNGEVGTTFDNDAWEGRLEVTHAEVLGFGGTFGLQLSEREFSAIGEEAFVPPVETDTTGVFWVAENTYGDVSLEVGARLDSVTHTPTNAGLAKQDFDTFSASAGAIWQVSEAVTWSALLDYSERAPSIEELYSNGPHLATQSFEIGDQNLDAESGINLSVAWSYQSDAFDANVSLYHSDFSDFIYQANTGEEEDELPVFVYRQNDAVFTGLDVELGWHLTQLAGGDLDLTAMFDTVKADVSVNGDQPLPRIPADRVGVGLAWKNDAWRARLNYTHVSEQNDIAAFELPTESYDDVSVRVSRRFLIGDNELSVFVSGRNLGDEEQREHVSFVKDVAPAPGRRIEAGVRFKF